MQILTLLFLGIHIFTAVNSYHSLGSVFHQQISCAGVATSFFSLSCLCFIFGCWWKLLQSKTTFWKWKLSSLLITATEWENVNMITFMITVILGCLLDDGKRSYMVVHKENCVNVIADISAIKTCFGLIMKIKQHCNGAERRKLKLNHFPK